MTTMENNVKTTFNIDFMIAEEFGEWAVRETFKRAFNEWKNNVEMFTAFTMVLNHRLFDRYNLWNEDMAHLYDELWREADEYAVTNFKGKDLDYYYKTTD